MKKIIVLLLIIVGCGAYYVMNHAEEISEAMPSKRVVVVLFDVSQSAEPMHEKYLSSFDKILDNLGPGERVVVDKISSNSLAEATYPVNDELPIYGITTKRSNPIYKKQNEEEVDHVRDDIREKVRSFVRTVEKSETTAIMDSLLLAERAFDTYPDMKPVLVIFSDMMEVSDESNFMRGIPTVDEVSEFVQREDGNGDKINLNKARIYVVGASAGGDHVTASEYQKLQEFWMTYFSEANAKLNKNDFGAALLTF